MSGKQKFWQSIKQQHNFLFYVLKTRLKFVGEKCLIRLILFLQQAWFEIRSLFAYKYVYEHVHLRLQKITFQDNLKL